MAYSHSVRSTKYPLERFFHPDTIAKPPGLSIQIPAVGHPQVAGIAFEILVLLHLSHTHLRKESVVMNLRNLLLSSYHYNKKLEAEALLYILTGISSDSLLKNVWRSAKTQQDMHAWGVSDGRSPKKDEIEELSLLLDWIKELKLSISSVILTGGHYLSRPDLLIRSRGKNIVFEFKLVSSLGRYRENLTQGLLYLLDYSCSSDNPQFDELWLFYPRYNYIHKISMKKALLPDAGSYSHIYKVFRRIYTRNRK
jgi:hypothetical protein